MYNRKQVHRNANIALLKVTIKDYKRRLREFLRQVKRWLRQGLNRIKQYVKNL
jgi:proline dehydrogenase